MESKILVIHGPNLNMLGRREPETYGSMTLAEINQMMLAHGRSRDLGLDFFQSNQEGELVEKIQQSGDHYAGLIINPAAYTHTSIAIRDALLLLDIPVIEVHLSNIHRREPFRHKSLISDVVTGQISGLGPHGYILALDALSRRLQP